MSDIIQLLPPQVANQIAAGEVVQRPASVVKELLENAVDAGATQIQLIVKDAGRTLVQVIDNGKGMSVTDARMAFERHATSKIHTSDDIFKIMTKGFRGEALASIAAVAQVELKTKQDEDAVGTCVQISGGDFESQEPAVTQKGSIISVKNLFYNVPARRNFLKSNAVEFRHILDEFHRVALSHENIDFTLIHNDEEIFRLTKANLAQRVLHIFGRKIEGQLVPISEETDIVKITGYVGKPNIAKKSRGEQFFFVNHRFIKSNYLHKSIQNAFEDLIPKGNHPSYFIFLELPPEKIDINIHPTKTEIKFEDEYSIFAQLRAATKHALGQYQVTPPLDFDSTVQIDVPILDKRKDISYPEISVDKTYNPFEVETPPVAPSSGVPKSGGFSYSPPPRPKSAGGSYDYYDLLSGEEELQTTFVPQEEIQETSQVLQWNNAYVVATYKGDLLLIDQHRAHQTILFYNFKDLAKKNTLSQQLLFPIEYPLDEKEKSLLNESLSDWLSFGFDMEVQGDVCLVNAIPSEISQENMIEILQHFFEEESVDDLGELKEHLCRIMAKSAAVKKGTTLNEAEINHLVQELFKLEQFNYSPFGKKIYYSLSLQEIQKKLD
uniref:DNA mismatch repair endonuclease MutL n=1 Tax=Ornithobacterium rhinotracheale TaxID=28251 RepID=UPI0039A4CD69